MLWLWSFTIIIHGTVLWYLHGNKITFKPWYERVKVIKNLRPEHGAVHSWFQRMFSVKLSVLNPSRLHSSSSITLRSLSETNWLFTFVNSKHSMTHSSISWHFLVSIRLPVQWFSLKVGRCASIIGILKSMDMCNWQGTCFQSMSQTTTVVHTAATKRSLPPNYVECKHLRP